MMFIEIPKSLKELAKFFPENLFVVGGYVRSKILGKDCEDIDITSSVQIDEVAKRLSETQFKVKVKNIKLGAILICKGDEVFEYTAFRKEIYSGGGHFPSKIMPTSKIEEDVQRRDFSINAIYYNINKDECVDLVHGVVDLSQKILRTTQNADVVLANDGERILRLVRIAGQLGFHIEKNTLQAAKKYAANVKEISGARIYGEIEKILYCDKNGKAKSVKKALKMLNDLQIWQILGIATNRVKHKMTLVCKDRFLGLLIDFVDSENPECLQAYLEKVVKIFGINAQIGEQIFQHIAGFYEALFGLGNREFFFKYFEDWQNISALLLKRSKHVQSKYNFYYRYIIENSLTIKVQDLNIEKADIAKRYPDIDERRYPTILKKLLSRVFDGKIENKKEILLDEIVKIK